MAGGPVHRPPRCEAHAGAAPFDGGDYYLGAFLLGAYQEILGDLHNLFGHTNTVHVRWGDREIILDSVIKAIRCGRCSTTCSFRPTRW